MQQEKMEFLKHKKVIVTSLQRAYAMEYKYCSLH